MEKVQLNAVLMIKKVVTNVRQGGERERRDLDVFNKVHVDKLQVFRHKFDSRHCWTENRSAALRHCWQEVQCWHPLCVLLLRKKSKNNIKTGNRPCWSRAKLC